MEKGKKEEINKDEPLEAKESLEFSQEKDEFETPEEKGEEKKKISDKLISGAKNIAGVTGGLLKGGLGLAGKGTIKLVKGGFWVGGKVIDTGILVKDKALREKFGFVYFRKVWTKNLPKIQQEFMESKYLAFLLFKVAQGYKLSEDEKHAASEQLKDLARAVPALGIFSLPGGAILLPIIAKALPWSMLPSAFREEIIEESKKQGMDPRHLEDFTEEDITAEDLGEGEGDGPGAEKKENK